MSTDDSKKIATAKPIASYDNLKEGSAAKSLIASENKSVRPNKTNETSATSDEPADVRSISAITLVISNEYRRKLLPNSHINITSNLSNTTETATPKSSGNSGGTSFDAVIPVRNKRSVKKDRALKKRQVHYE